MKVKDTIRQTMKGIGVIAILTGFFAILYLPEWVLCVLLVLILAFLIGFVLENR